MIELVTLQSDFSVKETLDRLASIVQTKGLTVLLRIDHSANAAQNGLHLRPTELIIFGNPKVGTVLMQDKQTSGLDVPMRALAWEDENGKVWLTYNEANFFHCWCSPLGAPQLVLSAGFEAMASPTAGFNGVIRSFFILYNELQNSNHLHLFHKAVQLNIYILPANSYRSWC